MTRRKLPTGEWEAPDRIILCRRMPTGPNGHLTSRPVDDPDIELVWLPVIGPSSMALARRIYRFTGGSRPAGVSIGTAELGALIGLSSASVMRVIARLVKFNRATYHTTPDGERIVTLVTEWPVYHPQGDSVLGAANASIRPVDQAAES